MIIFNRFKRKLGISRGEIFNWSVVASGSKFLAGGLVTAVIGYYFVLLQIQEEIQVSLRYNFLSSQIFDLSEMHSDCSNKLQDAQEYDSEVKDVFQDFKRGLEDLSEHKIEDKLKKISDFYISSTSRHEVYERNYRDCIFVLDAALFGAALYLDPKTTYADDKRKYLQENPTDQYSAQEKEAHKLLSKPWEHFSKEDLSRPKKLREYLDANIMSFNWITNKMIKEANRFDQWYFISLNGMYVDIYNIDQTSSDE